MTETGDPQYKLTIGDNGIGLPKDIDINNTKSFGLKLVKRLTEQLEGSLEVDLSTGTTYNITFGNIGNNGNTVNEHK